MTGHVTVDVDGYRHAADMSRIRFYGKPKCGGAAAESLGADAQVVDSLKQILFDLGPGRILGVLADGTQQGLLRQLGAFLAIAAHAHADDEGRAGVAARGFHRV